MASDRVDRLWLMAQMSPAINGAHRWIRLGVLRLNVQTMLWPVVALFARWLCFYRRIKPWMIYVTIGCICLIPAYVILSNANRAARFIGFFANIDPQHSKIYIQYQMRTAIEASNWIGCAGRSLSYLPCARTDSILAGVALTLGKCVSVCAIVLMGVIGGCLVKVRKMAAEPSKRRYTLLFGGVLLSTAIWCYLQNLLLVPAIGCTFSLLGYGGTDVLFSWLGLGIALSTLGEGDELVHVGGPLVRPWRFVFCEAYDECDATASDSGPIWVADDSTSRSAGSADAWTAAVLEPTSGRLLLLGLAGLGLRWKKK